MSRLVQEEMLAAVWFILAVQLDQAGFKKTAIFVGTWGAWGLVLAIRLALKP